MKIINFLAGVLFVSILSLISINLQNFAAFKAISLSPLILGLILGIAIKNVFSVSDRLAEGIHFCSKKVLRLAIVLLGFKISLMQLASLGYKPILLVVAVTFVTVVFAMIAAKKIGVPRSQAILIAGGVSICGASAVAAVNSVAKSDREDVAVSIGIVTLFGTVFMVLYPLLAKLLNMPSLVYSLWTGSSVHEVAQVVAAGFAVSAVAGTHAVVVKLARVLLIVPVTLGLAIRSSIKFNTPDSKLQIAVPWFVFFFLLMVVINSVISLPTSVISGILFANSFLMTAAMTALGLETSFASIRKLGLKPLYLGAATSVFISLISLLFMALIRI